MLNNTVNFVATVNHGTQVTPVPTYEEMLAWAEQVDARIAKGELSPIGSGRQTGDRGGADSGGVDGVLGSNQEQIEVTLQAHRV